MSFIQMKEFKLEEVIQKKQRISLIVKYSMESHLVFFKDKTFQHIDYTKAVLYSGNLEFVANKYFQSTKQGRVIVTGLSDNGSLQCAAIDTQNEYNIQARQVQNIRPQASTNYHLYESIKQDDSNIFFIRVLANIDMGIAIAAYDFWNNTWCEQMIALPSKFLQYHIINTSINNDLYKQAHQLNCQSFAIVSLGEKFDSINYSKIKFGYELDHGEKVLKIKFIITRELKLKKPFTIIGGYQCSQSQLLLVGNSRKDLQNPQQVSHSPAYLIINTAVLQNNELQQIRIFNRRFSQQTKQITIIKKFLGVMNGNIIVVVCLPFKKVGIAKFSINCQQLLFQSRQLKQTNFSLSVQKDCFCQYRLQCQYFFEKIKKSPSKITYNLIKIYDKQAHYQHLIKNGLAGFNPFFMQQVLNLLK